MGDRRGGCMNFGWETKARETTSNNLVQMGVLLKCIFRKISIRTRGELLWEEYQKLNFHKTRAISWLADQLLAAEAELPVVLVPILQTN